MKKCSNCGKEIDILHPDLWRYKNGTGFNVKEWFCRYNCMQAYRRRKDEEQMARMRKDGTPAKKPGPKQKVETAEKLPKVELVYDQTIAEEYRKEQAEKKIQPAKNQTMINGVEADDAQVTAIRFKSLGEFYFDSKFGTIDWRSNVGEEISLTPADWAELAKMIPKMLKLLGADD